MITFSDPVKFLGTDTRSGQKDGKDWQMTEAIISVPDVGRIKVMTKGKPVFPEKDQTIQLALSVDQGRFQSIALYWDENTMFQVVKKAA
jgi:hypothetical protein